MNNLGKFKEISWTSIISYIMYHISLIPTDWTIENDLCQVLSTVLELFVKQIVFHGLTSRLKLINIDK